MIPGFVGGHYAYHVTQLKKLKAITPSSKQMSLREEGDPQRFFSSINKDINAVVNFGTAKINSDLRLARKVNTEGALRLALEAHKLGIPYIHISTAAVMKAGDNISEEDMLSPEDDLPPYPKTKLVAELLLEQMKKKIGLDYTTIRLGICYGEHAHDIAGLMSLFKYYMQSRSRFVFTSKDASHSYTNVQKVPAFINHVIKNRDKFSGEAVNFVDPQPVNMLHLIRTIKDILEIKGEFIVPKGSALTSINYAGYGLRSLRKLGIDAKLPGELQFITQMYTSQTLSTKKLFDSGYVDPDPEATVFTKLPEMINYYYNRWKAERVLDRDNEFNPGSKDDLMTRYAEQYISKFEAELLHDPGLNLVRKAS